ncbi:hypothetical protein V8C35DRAFT_25248 [Trichoderma chlorosporum]
MKRAAIFAYQISLFSLSLTARWSPVSTNLFIESFWIRIPKHCNRAIALNITDPFLVLFVFMLTMTPSSNTRFEVLVAMGVSFRDLFPIEASRPQLAVLARWG